MGVMQGLTGATLSQCIKKLSPQAMIQRRIRGKLAPGIGACPRRRLFLSRSLYVGTPPTFPPYREHGPGDAVARCRLTRQ
jgi:hypothetical protein